MEKLNRVTTATTGLWRKSSRSADNGSCVEVAFSGPLVGLRDSKSVRSGHLALAAGEWVAFLGAVKDDHLMK